MPSKDLAVSLMVHTAKFAGVKIDNKVHHAILHKTILLSAWVQVLAGLILGGSFVYWMMRRKKSGRK
jgi:hypothetical protein